MDNPKKHAAAAAADSEAAGASNKRFKHFHDVPNALAQVDEEEKKQSSVVAAPAHASPISGLCSDELGAMLDFLARTDLSRALAVSRSWSAFIRSSMPCARFRVPCSAESVVELSSSALARHISAIGHRDKVRCKLPSDSLSILALAMPQLIFLQCELIPSKATKMILPPKLKTLDMDLSALDADGINRAVEGIGRLTALSGLMLVLPSWLPELSFAPLSKCVALEALTLMGPGTSLWKTQPSDTQINQFRSLHHLHSVSISWLNGASLTKLLRKPHALQWTELGSVGDVDSVGAALRELTIKAPPEVKWKKQSSDAQIDQFRALNHLRSVTIHSINSSSLPKLLRTPHSLQWTEMGELSGVDGVGAAALRNLPGLVHLRMWACRHISFLPALSQLQSLTLHIKENPWWTVTADVLVQSLSSCHQLTHLDLTAPVQSKHLVLLLPRLTHLSSLTLFKCSDLESLSFLSAVPSLQRTLESLELDHCVHPDLRSAEFRHILALKELSSLKMLRSGSENLDG